MDAVLAWFRFAVPALAAPGGLVLHVPDLTEDLLHDWGHEALANVLRSHGAQVPSLVEEAVAATSAALTAAVAGESPLPALWQAYQALLSWAGFSDAVASVAEVFPVEWSPVERTGQYAMTPADRCIPRPRQHGPRPLPEPELPVDVVDAGVGKLRAALFPEWTAWCKAHDLKPGSKRAKELRYLLLDRLYGASSLAAARNLKPGKVRPPARFWRDDSADLVGSLSWLLRWSAAGQRGEDYRPVIREQFDALLSDQLGAQ